MVTLHTLIQTISPHILATYQDQKLSQEYRGIYLVDDTAAGENDLIYIGSSDAILRLLINASLKRGCVLFSAGDSDALRNAPIHGATLIITDLSLTSLYNQLAQTFLQTDGWHQILTAAADKGIRHILKTATDLVGFSVMFLSPDLHPLYRSICPSDESFMLLKDLDKDSAAYSSLELLLEKLETSDQQLAVWLPRKCGYIYSLIPIIQEHHLAGYLFSCSSGRSCILNNMMYILARIISCRLLTDHDTPHRADNFQTLAPLFLDEHATDLDKLQSRLKYLQNKPRRFMRGIVIRLIDDDGTPTTVQSSFLKQMYQELLHFFSLDNVALLNECIYVMTSYDTPDAPITLDEDTDFQLLLQKYGAYAIISNPSQKLRGVRILFRQCFQLLPIAVAVRMPENCQQRCLRFDRYSPYYIVHLCDKAALSEMGVQDVLFLCHPAILTLTRYDRAYNNNLRDTLFTFLMNDRSISETSRQMFMHRNTTIYKLNKIEELIHDNLDNPYTRHQLILSCMIIRYAEQYLNFPVNLPPLESSLLHK